MSDYVPHAVSLRLSEKYVGNTGNRWELREALRETIQNWLDACLEADMKAHPGQSSWETLDFLRYDDTRLAPYLLTSCSPPMPTPPPPSPSSAPPPGTTAAAPPPGQQQQPPPPAARFEVPRNVVPWLSFLVVRRGVFPPRAYGCVEFEAWASPWPAVARDGWEAIREMAETRGILRLRNVGEIPANALAMGESSKRDDRTGQIIGVHGEGMKLSALSFLRLSDANSFVINSGGPHSQRWAFSLQMDRELFINTPSTSRSLHVTLTPSVQGEARLIPLAVHPGPYVDVKMEGVRPIDWQRQGIDNTLQLVDKVKMNPKVVVIRKTRGGEEIGKILLGTQFRSRLFVKGLYICINPFEANLHFGIDTNLALNRDRNQTTSEAEFAETTGLLLCALVNNCERGGFCGSEGRIEFDPAYLAELNELCNSVWRCHFFEIHAYRYCNFINEAGADFIFSLFRADIISRCTTTDQLQRAQIAQPSNRLCGWDPQDVLLSVRTGNYYNVGDYEYRILTKSTREFLHPREYVRRHLCNAPEVKDRAVLDRLRANWEAMTVSGCKVKVFPTENSLAYLDQTDNTLYIDIRLCKCHCGAGAACSRLCVFANLCQNNVALMSFKL
ncbi:hypothetical protein Pelo_13536 [Pelomyxa schiedti]|nr:hypothetical protein Pelo_13536 [Pelomyxa schiedti]